MNKKREIYLFTIAMLLAWLFIFYSFPLSAQKASVQATVQPAEITIGEQALINLKVITPKSKRIQFPVYESEIVPGVEVISVLPPDTTIENDVMTLTFKYVVTSFDSTLYYIPSMPVFDGTDTIFSNSFGFKVISPVLKDSTVAYLEKLHTGQTDSINFEQLQLNDIKGIQKPPFVWTDYLWILWIVLGLLFILFLIAGLVFLLVRKKQKGYFFTPPVVLPPHVRAIKALDKLKKEKIWQQNREKEFYTSLTEILRRYMTERFHMKAMEMTSDEILSDLPKFSEADSAYENMKQILTVSDLVKFAKYKPYADENDLSMMNAYLFVNQTREPDPLPDKDELKKGEVKEEKDD